MRLYSQKMIMTYLMYICILGKESLGKESLTTGLFILRELSSVQFIFSWISRGSSEPWWKTVLWRLHPDGWKILGLLPPVDYKFICVGFIYKMVLNYFLYSRFNIRIIKTIEIMNFKSMFLIIAMIFCIASAQQSNCSKCHRLIASGKISFKSHLGRACVSFMASPTCTDETGRPKWRRINGNGHVF